MHAHEPGEIGQPWGIPSSSSIRVSMRRLIQRSTALSIATGISSLPQRAFATFVGEVPAVSAVEQVPHRFVGATSGLRDRFHRERPGLVRLGIVPDRAEEAPGFVLARQATRNLEAITETGSVLVRGLQEISREWIELAQERLRKNTEGLARLAQCRNVRDFAAVQSELVRENLREMIDNTRRIAEHSMQVAQEAAQVITAETGKAAERFRRAA
jgi:hypothetical protein